MDDKNPQSVLLAWQAKIYEVVFSRQKHLIHVSSSSWCLSDDNSSMIQNLGVEHQDWQEDPCRELAKVSKDLRLKCKDCKSMDIISPQIVKDGIRGTFYPFILLRTICPQSVDLHLLRICEWGMELSRHFSVINLAKDVNGLQLENVLTDNFAILDGPNVLCVFGKDVFILNLTGSKRILKAELISPLDNVTAPNKIKTPDSKLLAHYPLSYPSCGERSFSEFLLLVSIPKPKESCNVTNSNTHKEFELPSSHIALAYKVTLTALSERTQLSIALIHEKFIPDIYIGTTLKVVIVNCRKSTSLVSGSHTANRIFYSEICIITSAQQMITFINGKTKKCCNLNSNPADLLMIENSADEVCYMVLDETGDAAFFNTVTSQATPKDIVKNVRQILVADFLNNGSEQLLLVVNKTETLASMGKWTNFILVDGDSIVMSVSSSTKKDTSSQNEDSIANAVKALENRAQRGQNFLASVDHELRSKVELMCGISKSFQKRGVGAPDSFVNKGLVALLGEVNDEASSSGDVPPSNIPTVLSPVSVFKQWHKVHNNYLIIGANIRNTSTRTLYNISVSLISRGEKTSRGQLFAYFRNFKDLEGKYDGDGLPRTKIPKLDSPTKDHPNLPERISDLDPEDIGELVILTELPGLVEESFPCPVLLSWINQEQSYSPGSNWEGERFELVLGNVEIPLSDIIEDGGFDFGQNLAGCAIAELALEVLQQKLTLVAESLSHNLPYQDYLWSQMSFNSCPELNYWVQPKDGPLRHVRVYPIEKEHRRFKFILYHRDEVQLSLFLHELYARLPDDVRIRQEIKTDSRTNVLNVLNSVLKEIEVTNELLVRNQKKDLRCPSSQVPQNSTSAADSVTTIRNVFSKKRAKIIPGDSLETIGGIHEQTVVLDNALVRARGETDHNMARMIHGINDMALG